MRMLAALTLLVAAAGAGLPAAEAAELAPPGRGGGPRTPPAGIPDFADAETLAHFTPVAQGSLWGNPDFPVLLARGLEPTGPVFILIVLDARNGKDTWSLVEDPMILVTVAERDGDSPATYVDEGFVTRGVPSGTFVEVGGATLSDLPDLLEGGYAWATSQKGM